MIVTEPGVYQMPEDLYHRDPVPGWSLSSSGARKMLPPSCPARYLWERTHPETSKAMNLGSAAHKLVLGAGPDLELVEAKNYQSKAAQDKRDKALADGKIPVLWHELEQVEAMAAALRAEPLANSLFSVKKGAGLPEACMFWTDRLTGVWCRARVDWLPNTQRRRGRLVTGDYKTTKSADPASVSRAVYSYGYHQQAAWYLDGVRALGLAADPAFLFVFQEKEPPYLVTVAELDATALRIGRERNREAIKRWRDCRESGRWPGYQSDPNNQIEVIGLPGWAVREHDGRMW